MDKQLIIEVKNRNQQALEQLIRQCRPLIIYVIRQLVKNQQDIEEVFNDTVLRIWNNIDRFDENKGSFNAWVTAIAHNLAVDKARKTENTVQYNDELLYGQSEEPSPKVNEILQIVRQMKKKDQLLFYKKYYYQLDTASIAAEMGMTERAVESALYRIRNRIRERIGK